MAWGDDSQSIGGRRSELDSVLALETVRKSGHMSVPSVVEGDMVKSRSEDPPRQESSPPAQTKKNRGYTALWTHVVSLQG